MKIHHRVKHHLKHLFIPHEGNEYRPHFFREISIAIILTIVFIIVSISASSAYVLQNTEVGKGIVSRVLIDLTNQERDNRQLPLLSYNSLLEKASYLKAEDMSSMGYFSHNSPTGVTPWHWFDVVGYDYQYAGENLAVNFSNSEEVSQAWMNSPLHRDNILNPNFKDIGISMRDANYENKNTIFVVQMFGTQEEKTKQIETETKVVHNQPINKQEIKVTTASSSDVLPDMSINDGGAGDQTGNLEVKGDSTTSVPVVNYSSDLEKTVFNSSKYASIALTVIFLIVFVALLIMIFIEIEKQHPKHILYGVFTLFTLCTAIYIIKTVFELNFVLI